MIADFSEKKPHSFLQDGVNLNPGGTYISTSRACKDALWYR